MPSWKPDCPPGGPCSRSPRYCKRAPLGRLTSHMCSLLRGSDQTGKGAGVSLQTTWEVGLPSPGPLLCHVFLSITAVWLLLY